MACVSEAIGLALPGSAGAPAPYETRDEYAKASGVAVMELIKNRLLPRDICTREAFENAAMVVAASGGSTNAGLHLPAMAHECGVEFDLFDMGRIFQNTPLIADLMPGGKYTAKDMFEVGGVPILALVRTHPRTGFKRQDLVVRSEDVDLRGAPFQKMKQQRRDLLNNKKVMK